MVKLVYSTPIQMLPKLPSESAASVPSRPESHRTRASAMAGGRLWRSVRVLLWKNWRVKQRESRLNRGRSGRRWLYPALLTDIVVPLALLLVLIQKLCEYNAQLVAPAGVDALDAFLERHKDAIMMEPQTETEAEPKRALWPQQQSDDIVTQAEEQQLQHVTVESGTLLLAALPLMLAKTNQSLAILERRETEKFLQYLDQCVPLQNIVAVGVCVFYS